MDMLKLSSKFMRSIAGKLIKMAIRNKIGYDVDIIINEFEITTEGEKAHLHMNFNATIDKDNMIRIVKNIGLE